MMSCRSTRDKKVYDKLGFFFLWTKCSPFHSEELLCVEYNMENTNVTP